jgi:hypothetical protein
MLLFCGLIAAASRTESFTNPQNSYRLSWPNSFSEKKGRITRIRPFC